MKKSYSRQKNNCGIRMAWVVLLSYLFVVLVGINGNILCLEADGCVTLEIAENGACCSFSTGASPSHSLPELTSLAHEDLCGPCVDIPLWIEGADHYIITDHEQVLEKQPTALIAFSPSTSGLTAIESPLQIPSPGINSSLISHRTVILLI